MHCFLRNFPMSQGPSVTIAKLYLVPSCFFSIHFSNEVNTSLNKGAASTSAYIIERNIKKENATMSIFFSNRTCLMPVSSVQ